MAPPTNKIATGLMWLALTGTTAMLWNQRNENEEAETENTSLRAYIEQLQTQLEMERAANIEARAQNETLKSELQDEIDARIELAKENKMLQEKLQQEQRKNEKLMARLADVNTDNRDMAQELDIAKNMFFKLENAARSAKNAIYALQEKLDTLTERMEVKTRHFNMVKKQLAEKDQTSANEMKEANDRYNRLYDSLIKMRNQYAELEDAKDAVVAELHRTQRKYASLQEDVELLRKQIAIRNQYQA